MNPGEIHLIQFDPSIESEIQKRRPGLVIQKSPQRNMVIVLPISSKKLTHPSYEVELRQDNQNQLYADSVVIKNNYTVVNFAFLIIPLAQLRRSSIKI